MKKVALLIFMLMLTGCWSSSSEKIPMFNNLWGKNPNSVTVIKGDTLYSISRRYNVPVRDLIEVNGLRPPYALRIGQSLRLPNAKIHVVSKGDTVYNISKRYNVDQASLSRLNNIKPPHALAIGQRLVLPGSVVSTANSTTTQSTWKPSPSSATQSKQTYTPVSVAKKRTAKFVWPVKGTVISPYGSIAKGRSNDGINIKAPQGTDVKAADKGTVAYAGNELKGFGNLILIRHDDGWVTAYAHNAKLFVKKGQRVIRGEKIAAVGNTGGAATPQLHFEIRAGKKPVNPIGYLE